jgi:hypothetical protein
VSGRRYNKLGAPMGPTHSRNKLPATPEVEATRSALAIAETRKHRSKPVTDSVGVAALGVFDVLAKAYPALGRNDLRAATVALFYRYFTYAYRMRPDMFDRYIPRLTLPECERIADALDAIPREHLDPWHLGRANEVMCAGANGSH